MIDLNNDGVLDVVIGNEKLRRTRLWQDGKRDEAAARVPADLAVKVNLLGTEAMVRERVETYRRAGITTLRVDPGGGTLRARLDTLARFMDLVRAA